MVGEIVTWKVDGGYGFLRRAGGGRDVFVNLASLELVGADNPKIGDRFSFLVEDDDNGRPRATDLRREGVDAAARQIFNPVRP